MELPKSVELKLYTDRGRKFFASSIYLYSNKENMEEMYERKKNWDSLASDHRSVIKTLNYEESI